MKRVFNNPDSTEREYVRVLLRFVRGLQEDAEQVLVPKLPEAVAQFKQEMRADGWAEFIERLLAELAYLAGIRQRTTVATLPGFFAAVNAHNDREFRLIVKANTGVSLPPVMSGATASPAAGSLAPLSVTPSAAPLSTLGVAPFRTEPFLQPLGEGWVKENVALIKSIPQQLHPQLEALVQRGVMNGLSVKALAEQIKEVFATTENRAKLIAQDQTLKLQSRLTEYRLKSVGVEKYTWRTVRDSRVRPEHVEREGKQYSWDKPPHGGLHPGQEVRCRCRAEAVWD